MSRWNLCRALLDARMGLLPGVTAALISWPNRAFDKPAGQVWYKVDFLPQDVDAASGLGGDTHEKGTYQVSVYAPANDPKGLTPGLTAADAVTAHFDRKQLTGSGLTLQCDVPIPSPMVQEPDWIQIPVSIRFVAL